MGKIIKSGATGGRSKTLTGGKEKPPADTPSNISGPTIRCSTILTYGLRVTINS